MRKKEYEVLDHKAIEEVLKSTEIGYLAFSGPDGWPRITPLNFIFDGRVLWHGAIAGERFECLKQDPRATFSAVGLQIYVPSHFVSEENAASASVFYKSVQVRGGVTALEDPEEKCSVLNQLMEKYQPEGRYRKVSPSDDFYQKLLSITGVYALSIEHMTGKFKFPVNKPEEDRRKIVAKLQERGKPEDLLVAHEILKTL